MLKLILALAPLAVTLTGQAATSTPAPAQSQQQTAAKKTTQKSAIQGIPAGAVKIDENTYRFQEKDASGKPGKVWLFRRNPFGVSKIEEKDAAKIGTPLTPVEVPVVAIEQGDSYRFERSGPFGSKVWTKKKTELNDEERAIIQRGATSTQKATN